MGQFSYEARNGEGDLITGIIDAISLEDAGRRLSEDNKFVIKLAPDSGANSRAAQATRRRSGKGVKRRDVIFFTNQMAVMVETGIPLSDAMESLTRQTKDPKFRSVLQGVTDAVQAGKPFSEALIQYPKAFPPITTALLRASESSGTMDTMLTRIAGYLVKEQRTLRKIKGALLYPLFMLVMCVSVTVFLLTFVLPQFAKIYASKGGVLPGPTRLLMAMSNGLVNHWILWLIGTIVVTAMLMLWYRTALGQLQSDWLKLHVPVFSGVFSKLYQSRAYRTIETLIDAGVSLLETINIVKAVTPNKYYDRLWEDSESSIRKGRQLSDAMFDTDLIPEAVAQMVQSGEKSGRLGLVFSRLAEFTEDEFDQAVDNATQFIEPVMIVVMGGIIGFVVIALLLPIFSIGQVMAG